MIGRNTLRTTGPGTLVGLRCHAPFLKCVDEWRARQEDKPSRPAAVIRLAEIGVALAKPIGGTSSKAAAKASAMAGQAVERLADQSVPLEERSKRKRRLLKGPVAFHRFRRNHK